MKDYYLEGRKLDLEKTVGYYLDLNPELKPKVFKHLPMLKMAENMKLKTLAMMAPDKDSIQQELDEYAKLVKEKGYTINLGE